MPFMMMVKAMRCPNPFEGEEGQIELRPSFETPDLTAGGYRQP